MYDIISIGDTTVDMFLMIDEATVQCDIHKENCQLCLSYADKVPVRDIKKIYAVGNAANNAVGSSRLGLKVGLYTILGDDMDGKLCLEVLKKEKVSNAYIEIDKKRGTNYSTVLDYKSERTILVYHQHRTYQLPRLDQSRWVYYTSAKAGCGSLHPALVSYLKKTGAKLAFNPGTFQLKMGREMLEPILRHTEVLFLNKEEARLLLGTPGTISELGGGLAELGARTVVITDGSNGSYCLHDGMHYVLPIFPAKVVERTGAGDAYATAFVAALAHGESVDEAMRWGTMNSASVIGYIGAQEGLLTKHELRLKLKNNLHFQPKKVTHVKTLAGLSDSVV